MSYHSKLKEDPRAAIFETMDDVRAGMLGLTGSKDGMQPMTHFPDEDAGVIWFISSTKTSLVSGIGQGAPAGYCLIGKDHDVHASILGTLSQVKDQAKLEELWSPMVGAWFKGGPDDPSVALLCFKPERAEVWASDVGALRFGYEMARATVDDGHQPDLGTHAEFHFPQ
jgi:general stress protein 26